MSINPEKAAVDRILSLMPVPGAVDVVPFFGGRLLVAGFVIRPEQRIRRSDALPPQAALPGDADVGGGDPSGRASGRCPTARTRSSPATSSTSPWTRGRLENVLALLGLRRGVEREVMIAGATRIGICWPSGWRTRRFR